MIRQGYVIVSGGAYGIDALAHEITLKYSGQTIVVFGAGVDVVYPATHRQLFEDIVVG
jgi:DNA processing protein